jgi:hypothetical protein
MLVAKKHIFDTIVAILFRKGMLVTDFFCIFAGKSFDGNENQNDR